MPESYFFTETFASFTHIQRVAFLQGVSSPKPDILPGVLTHGQQQSGGGKDCQVTYGNLVGFSRQEVSRGGLPLLAFVEQSSTSPPEPAVLSCRDLATSG